MDILYIGKHGPHDNEDEDAIAYALRKLGHSVHQLPDTGVRRWPPVAFTLCHQTCPIAILRSVNTLKVCWDFDMIESPEPFFRQDERIARITDFISICNLVCLSDGNYVAKDQSGKVIRLLQGADERYLGPGISHADRSKSKVRIISVRRDQLASIARPPIVFFGNEFGERRKSHVAELRSVYGNKFETIGSNKHSRLHGRALANYIAGRIVIAPDGPASGNYWSNRVYLTLGLGGFLMHPWHEQLATHFEDDKEIVFYRTRAELHDKIMRYLHDRPRRDAIAAAGHEKTKAKHLYRHRCEELLAMLKQRLGLQ